MTDCTFISTPVDPVCWLEACEAHRTSLVKPTRQAAFADTRFELWPFLMGRDGRLHPTWSPTAWTGRISAKGPALQAMPEALRVGIRSPGKLIVTADWRGSHLRLLAHYTGDEVLTADLHGDVYAVPAAILVRLGVPEANARKAAKKALLTKLNGGGKDLLRSVLVTFGGPTDIDVEAFTVPLIRRWARAFRTLGQVYFDTEKAGWKLTAPYGEVVEVPEDKRNPHHVVAGWLQLLEAEALRHVVRFAGRHHDDPKCIVRLVAIVHDETVWEVAPENADKGMALVRKLMNKALFPDGSKLADTSTDVHIGPSWGEQDGTRTPPAGTPRARSAWTRKGVEAVIEASNASPVKAAVHLVLSDPQTRFAVEMARLHGKGDLEAAIGRVKAATGGREAASALASQLKRVDGTVVPYVTRTEAKAASDTGISFERADHVELSEQLLVDLGGLDQDRNATGKVVADRGSLWSVGDDGQWHSHRADAVRVTVQGYAGSPVGPRRSPLSIRFGDTVSALKAAMDRLASEGHFDGQVEGVPFSNGLLLSDGTFRAYEACDRVMADQVLPVPFDPDATCPRFQEFLDEIYEGEPDVVARIQVLREFIGAALLGVATRYQKALFLVGEGENGKSVLLFVIEHLFNPASVVSLPPQKLSGGKSEYYAARLATARLNVVNEMPPRDLLESETVKAAITGDTICGRDPCERPFEFSPIAAWIIAANELPAVRDTSHGFWRRPLILTHNRKFLLGVDADPGLKERLVETELAGVAAWAVKGALDLVARGHYPDLQSSVAAVKTWREEADSVASFASEHLVADPVERFRALKLYKTYQEWCRDHGCRPTKSLNFWKRMVKAGFEKGKDRDGKYYRVKLVNDWRVEGCDNRIDLLDDEDAGLSLILGGGAGS